MPSSIRLRDSDASSRPLISHLNSNNPFSSTPSSNYTKTNEKLSDETLLETLLPAPPYPPKSHPVRRIASFGTLVAFSLGLAWFLITAGPGEFNRGGMAIDAAKSAVEGWKESLGSWVGGGRTVGWGDEVGFSSTSEPRHEDDDDDDDDEVEDDADEERPLGYGVESYDRDYAKFLWHEDLEDTTWDGRGKGGRLIVIGDLHGMFESFKSILDVVRYKEGKDTLILVGDIVAKHPSVSSSLSTIRHARLSGAKAVRGNHDQEVVQWRTWMETFRKFPVKGTGEEEETWDGVEWLFEADQEPNDEVWDEKGWNGPRRKVPHGWKWRSQHFEIARRLPQKDYEYFLSLPLTLHIPQLHTYIVHAGLLPWSDLLSTSTSASSEIRPAHRFNSSSPSLFVPKTLLEQSILSSDPERSILLVKQNRDPFTLLNVRTVKKDGTPTKKGKIKKKKRAWTEIWDKAMRKAELESTSTSTTSADVSRDKGRQKPLMAIYGHWAARNLQVEDFSIGLDSGCVYGRRLSALIIEPVGGDLSGEEEQSMVGVEGLKVKVENVKLRVAGGRKAKILSIGCKEP